MIDVQNLAFAYPNTADILKGISFELEGGHCLALLGNNGAGKSTLLNCLNGILKATSGVVRVNGNDLRQMKRSAIAKEMAYVAQSTDPSQLTVFDGVLLGRKPYIKLNPTEEDYAITRDAIHRLGLDNFALRYMDELSGGELQKVILARALAQQPKVLLLDEPTSNLDLHNQHEVMSLVSDVARKDGILVIVVIHDLNLALRYCDRFLLVHNGEVYQYGDESIITEKILAEIYKVDAKVVQLDGQTNVIVKSFIRDV